VTRMPNSPLLTVLVAIACLSIILAVLGLVMLMDPLPEAAR
jgi:hypothetical protein